MSRCSGRTARSVGGLTPRSRPGGAIPYRRGKPAARRVAPARVPGLLGGIRDSARPGPATPSLTHSVDAAVARRQRARCPGRGSRVLQRHAEVRVAALEPSGDGSTPSIRADVRPFSALPLKRGGSAAQLVQRGLDAAQKRRNGRGGIGIGDGAADLGGRVDEVATEVVELVVGVAPRRGLGSRMRHGRRLTRLACASYRVQPALPPDRAPRRGAGWARDAVSTSWTWNCPAAKLRSVVRPDRVPTPTET